MISEQLRVTILSLKQISDRLKLLKTTSVTKSEALAYKNEIIEALGSIDEKIDDISTGLKDVAQEETLLQGVSDIRSDIANIPAPDLSTVAKQGDNPEATNTAILEASNTIDKKIDDISTDLEGVAQETTNISNSINVVIEDYGEQLAEIVGLE